LTRLIDTATVHALGPIRADSPERKNPMSTITINLPVHVVKAVARALPDKSERREQLLGIRLECTSTDTVLIATDGHRMHAAHCRTDGSVSEPIAVTVPLQIVSAICAIKAPRNGVAIASLIIDTQAGEARLQVKGASTVAPLVNMPFPDWRRVIPANPPSGEAAVYQPSYLEDAYSAVREYQGRSARGTIIEQAIGHNGPSPGILSVDGFLVIIMPMRVDACTDYVGFKFKEPLVPAHAIAAA
jgi:hypothetical protein